VEFKFIVSKNTDSWFIKEPKSSQRVSDIGASSSTEESHCSPAVKKSKKKSGRFPDANREERPQCVLCGDDLANDSLNTRNLRDT
jgi:hypothetical protein